MNLKLGLLIIPSNYVFCPRAIGCFWVHTLGLSPQEEREHFIHSKDPEHNHGLMPKPLWFSPCSYPTPPQPPLAAPCTHTRNCPVREIVVRREREKGGSNPQQSLSSHFHSTPNKQRALVWVLCVLQVHDFAWPAGYCACPATAKVNAKHSLTRSVSLIVRDACRGQL